MKIQKQLPQLLILKRAYMQTFPNGQQVALYHSDHLNQYVTVPLDGSQFTNTTESFIEQLKAISESDIVDTLKFQDDSELNIDKQCADIVLEYVGDDKELTNNICLSETSFLDILSKATEILSEQMELETVEKELSE